MKKLLLCLAILFLGLDIQYCNAQSTDSAPSEAKSSYIYNNSIGLRFAGSGSNAYGTEVSYQKKLSAKNRLEAGVGISGKSFFAVASYQWVWALGPSNFNWYIGPGAGLVFSPSAWGLGIVGVLGIEYDFNTMNLPILVSLDIRPSFGFGKAPNSLFSSGLGIRYTF